MGAAYLERGKYGSMRGWRKPTVARRKGGASPLDSIIAAAILCVVVDNKKRPEYQNLTNVYFFIAEMWRDRKVA